MLIRVADPHGIRSELSPKVLPENYATIATNCFLDAGSIIPWNAPLDNGLLGKSNELKGLHLLDNSIWLHWNEEIQAALAPIANNDNHLTIFTGSTDGKTRYTDKIHALGGGGDTYPVNSYFLGFPAPTSQPTGTIVQTVPEGVQFQWQIAGTEGDEIGSKVTYLYQYTFVTPDGSREGPPSPISEIIYASKDDTVTLSGFEQLTGTYEPNHLIRVYRSAGGGPFQFLMEVPGNTVNINDDFTLTPGNAIKSTTWTQPPDNMKGIITLANGMMAGYVGNDLYLSEPYQPHAWPEDYIQHVDYPIVGLVANGNSVIISTEKYPYTGVGNHPEVFTLNKLETIQANVNLRSMIDIGSGAMYASRDGIVGITREGATIVSNGIISEKTWREMNPSSIHAYYYREKYFGFYDTGFINDVITENGETIPGKGGFIFDPAHGDVTYTDQHCDVAYSDLNTGSLHMVQSAATINSILEWNAGTTKLLAQWKMKPLVTGEACFTAIRFEMKSGLATYIFIADGVDIHTDTISDSNIHRLPSGYKARVHELYIFTDGEIDAIFIASNPSEII